MKLNDSFIRSIPLNNKPKKYFDGGGLYLLVNASGKYWRYKYLYYGKEKTLSLGVYPAVSLKNARIAHMEAKVLLSKGKCPSLEKRVLKLEKRRLYEGSTFDVITKEWFEMKKERWSENRAKAIHNDLKRLALPHLRGIPINDIPPLLLFDALKRASHTPTIANRLKQHFKSIFDYAILIGKATHNPANALPSFAQKTEHHLALPQSRIPEFFERVETLSHPIYGLMLKFLVLTFVRVGELVNAEWSEIHGNEWHIPAQKMKMRRPHIVPLSDWALEILYEVREATIASRIAKGRITSPSLPLIFTSKRYRPLQYTFPSILMRELGYQGIAVPHGFRSLASSILNESGLWNTDAIERQLAHQEENKTRAAYNRAEYLEERHKMMQWYSDYIKNQQNHKKREVISST